MSDPTFSVVIPTLNRGEFLAAAVESVLAQTVGDFECIVVDDGGQERLKLPTDERIQLIRHGSNLGVAAARNSGISHARGRFVTFLDDDDLFTADRFESVSSELAAAELVCCWSTWLGEQARPQRVLEGDVFDSILDTTTPHLGTVTLPRERAQQFDTRYRACEDLEWWLRTAKNSRVRTVPRVGYLVRRHPGARVDHGDVTRLRFSIELLRERDDYFRDHPRAAAFRWYQVGVLAARLGDHRFARHAYQRAMRVHPQPKAFRHFTRSMRTSTTTLDIEALS